MNFYKKLGFAPLNYDFNLFKVVFTPLVLNTNKELNDEDVIVQEIIKIYYELCDEQTFKKNCSIEKHFT